MSSSSAKKNKLTLFDSDDEEDGDEVNDVDDLNLLPTNRHSGKKGTFLRIGVCVCGFVDANKKNKISKCSVFLIQFLITDGFLFPSSGSIFIFSMKRGFFI